LICWSAQRSVLRSGLDGEGDEVRHRLAARWRWSRGWSCLGRLPDRGQRAARLSRQPSQLVGAPGTVCTRYRL